MTAQYLVSITAGSAGYIQDLLVAAFDHRALVAVSVSAISVQAGDTLTITVKPADLLAHATGVEALHGGTRRSAVVEAKPVAKPCTCTLERWSARFGDHEPNCPSYPIQPLSAGGCA